jgi:hypothetical protein
MKTEAEFKEYYDKNLSGMIESYREQIKRRKNQNWFTMVAGLVLLIIFGAIMLATMIKTPPIFGLVVFVVLMVNAVTWIRNNTKFSPGFYNGVMDKLLKIFGDLEFEKAVVINDLTLQISEIVPAQQELIFSNRIEGIIDNLHLKACILKIEKNNYNIKTYEHSLFMFSTYAKDFNGKYILFTKSLNQKVTDFFNKMREDEYSIIHLEDPEFEKYYSLYATDNIEARYLLTPAMMQRLVSIKQDFNIDLNISYIRSNIFMCFTIPKQDISGINTKSLDYDGLKQAFDFYNTTFEIMHRLNPQTSIWGKEIISNNITHSQS